MHLWNRIFASRDLFMQWPDSKFIDDCVLFRLNSNRLSYQNHVAVNWSMQLLDE